MNKNELNQLNQNKCRISTRTCSLLSPLLLFFNIIFGENIIETKAVFYIKFKLVLVHEYNIRHMQSGLVRV